MVVALRLRPDARIPPNGTAVPEACGGKQTVKPVPADRSLVVRPHPNDLDDSFALVDLIHDPVLNVQPP